MRKNNGFGDTKAILHQMNDFNVYQVTDSDLEQIESGSNSDLYLEIALCSISVFASFLCTLLTLDFNNNNTKEYPIYVIVTIISAIAAVVFLLLWYRNRRNARSIIDKIKSQKVVEE